MADGVKQRLVLTIRWSVSKGTFSHVYCDWLFWLKCPIAKAAEITTSVATIAQIALDLTWHIAAVYNSIVYHGLVTVIADVQFAAVRWFTLCSYIVRHEVTRLQDAIKYYRYVRWISLQSAPLKTSPIGKISHLSNCRFLRIYFLIIQSRIQAKYAANFIKIFGMILQITITWT